MLNPLSFTLQNIHYFQQDFSGIRFNEGIFLWLLSFLGVVVFLFLLYLIGTCIRLLIFRISFTQELLNMLLSLALGHIFFSTGIAILGCFSLFTTAGIISYLFGVAILTSIGLLKLKGEQSINSKKSAVFFTTLYKKNKVGCIFLVLFLLLGLTKLLVPEIGVDAIYYHFDYPLEYLRIHSMMEYPKGTQTFLTTPQLGQMLNVVLLFFHLIPGLRILHFLFFLCVTLLLLIIGTARKITSVSILPALLFAASPTVIGVMGSGYMDMEWILCWLLAFYFVTSQKLTKKMLILIGVIFGGTLAAKIQALPFFLTLVAIIFLRVKNTRLSSIILFTTFSFLISSLWYIRSIIITGSPIFYYHAPQTFSDHIGLLVESNYPEILRVKLMSLFSNYHPFIIFSLFLSVIIIIIKKNIKQISSQLVFALLLLINYSFLPILYFTGRFWLFGYSVFSTTTSQLPIKLMQKKWFALPLWSITLITFFYYFVNSLLIIPYGLGWADTNKYLTRVLPSNNASYYDFDHLFSPFIKETDVIGTYTINGFLYANFSHRDIAYVVTQHDSFDNFKRAGFTKLLIKHGDMEWFCGQLELTGCSPNKYTFLSYYAPAQQYLYALK